MRVRLCHRSHHVNNVWREKTHSRCDTRTSFHFICAHSSVKIFCVIQKLNSLSGNFKHLPGFQAPVESLMMPLISFHSSGLNISSCNDPQLTITHYHAPIHTTCGNGAFLGNQCGSETWEHVSPHACCRVNRRSARRLLPFDIIIHIL